MRQVAKSKRASRQQISRVRSESAPTGGWNALDPLSDMPAGDAIALDNWFPGTSYCETRGGKAVHATGMTGTGKTLVVYNALNGLNDMFCSTASGVYNVSSAGAVGASVAARTNGKHRWLMFGDGTNQWLIMVNGVDKPLYYNGTTWTAVDGGTSPALTGITTSLLTGLCAFKGRLMFIPVNDLAFWYLPSGVAGGALTKFSLSGVAQKGGYLMAMDAWTLDSGAGPEDRMVFVTSEGECVVYQGTDPSAAATWSLVGVYPVGKPLGRRCILRSGSDLTVLTENGVFQINTIVQATAANYSNALSRKIENAFNGAARTYGLNFGWAAVVFPTRGAAIVNIPITEDSQHEQYVMNTITKAWCRFTGWNAEDFVVFNNELYFCESTAVKKAWFGSSDEGANITAYAKSAFNYFGNSSQQKRFNMIRPVMSVNGSLDYIVGIDVDFADTELAGLSSSSSDTLSIWDVAVWDDAMWGAGFNIIKDWHHVNQWGGYVASGKLRVDTKDVTVQWFSTDYLYESGGVI